MIWSWLSSIVWPWQWKQRACVAQKNLEGAHRCIEHLLDEREAYALKYDAERVKFERADSLFQERDAQYAAILMELQTGTDPIQAIRNMRTSLNGRINALIRERDAALADSRECGTFFAQIVSEIEGAPGADPLALLRALKQKCNRLEQQIAAL